MNESALNTYHPGDQWIKACGLALHDTRPPPRHRHALDAPGPGPMAPRGANARAAHRVLPVARTHAPGLGGLPGRAR